MRIQIPDPCLVVLIGASGSGKSTFARKHFKPTEVLSSDVYRGMVSDDENAQAATGDAFDALHFIARKRLSAPRLTVIDATNVQPSSRKSLVALAREHDLFCLAIVLDLPERECRAHNEQRSDRALGPHVVRGQTRELRRSLKRLRDEGFRQAYVLKSALEVDAATVERRPLWTDRRAEAGPFDIIGDIHGCGDELEALLGRLGYGITRDPGAKYGYAVEPPAGRRAIFLGDLVDRGPRIVDVLRLVMTMVAAGAALCVPGNHEAKLLRKLRGRDVRLTHGLAASIEQLEAEGPELRAQVAEFIDGLVSHYVLDDGKLVVAHAGMRQALQGRSSGRVREFALYGESTGETDEYGLPIRADWAGEYRGRAMVVYGHTPTAEAEWVNNTINVDTGCVFGGKLTALRYPERELVSVPATREHYAPVKPLVVASAATAHDAARGDLLDLDDVLGKRVVQTVLHGRLTIREENAAAALETMSRFAVDPRWLIYLPPTMSPCATSDRPEWLEHPAEAFAYYREQGIARVICEEKHMGSRAVAVVWRDEHTARARFGAAHGIGVVYTRTGRPFFQDQVRERELLDRLRLAAERAGLFASLETSWLCLDAELMPWSAKAQELLRNQYAPTGAAGRVALAAAESALAQAQASGLDVGPLRDRFRSRASAVADYVDAYRRYCWKVGSLDDLRFAPFHLLASEGQVHTSRDHAWHMDIAARLAACDPELIVATAHEQVELADPESEAEATRWWEELTQAGGEGMVVKPLSFIAKGRKSLAQPAVKVRGREYLRIIYGPEYALPEHIDRLRSRSLASKRSLALREFSLGVEALERFARGEPLYRVHECVFGVLALESEPVDPRL